MISVDVTMKKVVEASYLTADSAAQYRTILRYFYHQHERMRDFIGPEEILEYMRSIPVFLGLPGRSASSTAGASW